MRGQIPNIWTNPLQLMANPPRPISTNLLLRVKSPKKGSFLKFLMNLREARDVELGFPLNPSPFYKLPFGEWWLDGKGNRKILY